MARKVDDDEERERRIELVGTYRLLTGDSLRAIAKYFTDNGYFTITYATVKDYLERYKRKHPEHAATIDRQTKDLIPKTIDDPKIIERVRSVANHLLDGFTIEQISEMLGYEYWVVYRDLTRRLPKVDKFLFAQVREVLRERKIGNLINHGKKY